MKTWTMHDIPSAGIEIHGLISEMIGVDLPQGDAPSINFFRMTDPQIICVAAERWVQFEPKGWHEMQLENARLISAAPDLLEALENIMALIKGECPSLLEDDHHYDMAMSAIEKAKGTHIRNS